jgi:putative Ca2+/H+ antiporter (TMEM165/GDT1 family)
MSNMQIKKCIIFVYVFVIMSENFISCKSKKDVLKEDQPKNKQDYLQSFFSGYCLIFISELLDRTFFLNMIYALTHSFMKTFVISSLTLLTLNSAALILGNSMPFFFYKNLIDWIAVFVFFLFGTILLYDSLAVNGHILYEDYKEVETEVRKQSHEAQETQAGLTQPFIQETKHEPAFDTSWSFVTSLILAECGDKSQITGVVIGAVYNFYGVLLGTSLGYLTCILLAIWSGHFLSKRITKRQIHFISGVFFILFGISYLFQLLHIFRL